MSDRVLDPHAQDLVIAALYANPQGVLRMSDTVAGLVETSTNMGITSLAEGQLSVTSLMRSSVDSELHDVHEMIASVWELAGIEPVFSGLYSAWQPNPNSQIVILMEAVYQDLYGQQPRLTAIHAGLEVGVITSTYPNLDSVSIGPTLQDVHTSRERLQIDTVKKLNDLLVATLKQIPSV
jgi:dipeptidase D